MSLVEQARAQCVLGNHELSLLCAEYKPGNAWFCGSEPRGAASGRGVCS